jgi:hypothetical protein
MNSVYDQMAAGAGQLKPASSFARWKTLRSMGWVSLPVLVFCSDG